MTKIFFVSIGALLIAPSIASAKGGLVWPRPAEYDAQSAHKTAALLGAEALRARGHAIADHDVTVTHLRAVKRKGVDVHEFRVTAPGLAGPRKLGITAYKNGYRLEYFSKSPNHRRIP